MQVVKVLALLAVVISFLGFVYSRVYQYNKSYGSAQKNKRILKYPRLYSVMPLCLLAFSVSISAWIFLFQFEYWQCTLILLGVLGLPSLIVSIAWGLWKVEIKDEGFVYRNFFGRKVEYNYIDLEYRVSSNGLKWYFYKGDKKVVSIAHYIGGGDLLYKTYKKAIKKVA